MPHLGILVKNNGGAEVDYLDEVDLVTLHQEQVLWLQVSVNYLSIVTVHDCREQLFHNDGGVHLAEVLDLRNLIEQLSPVDVLRNEIKIHLILIELKDLDDIRVVKLLQDIYFIDQGIHVLLAHVLFSNDLHGPEFSGCFVLNLFNFPVGPFPEGLKNTVSRLDLPLLLMHKDRFIYFEPKYGFCLRWSHQEICILVNYARV